MGRHSSGGRIPYVMSLAGWVLPWVLVAATVGIAVWFVVSAIGGDDIKVDNASRDAQDGRGAAASPEEPETTPTQPTPTPEKNRAGKNEPGGAEGSELLTEGVTVQVLNGTGGIEGAAEAMADRLARLGYGIFAIQTGLTTDQTVVYWTGAEDRAAGEALARRYGWLTGPAPPDLSDEVDLHVVVSAADA